VSNPGQGGFYTYTEGLGFDPDDSFRNVVMSLPIASSIILYIANPTMPLWTKY